MMDNATVLIVGAGFAGSVIARELAEAGHRVLVIDRRAHIGGNAYDEYDSHGVLIHTYGPHIFHTNAERIWQWLSRFTEWHKYEHRVLAKTGEQLVPIPVNRTTINKLYGLNLDEPGVADFLEKVREQRTPILTSEDVVLNSVGSELCELFFRGYSKKQWGLNLDELNAGVAARIPTRTNDDDRYFDDRFQAMPKQGYSKMFERILDHANITLQLQTDYKAIRGKTSPLHTVYTGPIDAYYDYRFGKLPYRSLRLEHQHFPDTEWYQPVCTVNYPNEHAYTRVTEFKHATGQKHTGTSIVREYPRSEGDPYYPIPRPENEARYQQYRLLAENEPNVTFVGRLAQYRYYNMDQVVAAALNVAKSLVKNLDNAK
ncbi:MAG: UDP-galactopyranose mutase [Granulosicoccaceae bacterium]|jgi:UDP-galactopyranose mutase